MNNQIDMDAIKISAEMWYRKFRQNFDESWYEGLEQPQQEQPQAPMFEQPIESGGLENA